MAITELLALGLSDAEILSGGWLAEWTNPEARHEFELKLAALRRGGGPPAGAGLEAGQLVEEKPGRRAGPELIATRLEVEAIRDALVADGKSHGYKSIAKAGGWSVATVRRRLAGN